MKIVAWKKYDDLNKDLTYAYACDDERIELIVNEMREKGYRFSGYYHQNGEHGTPVFDDNTYTLVSMRRWGTIVSRVLNDDDPMSYCLYAWNMDDEIYPEM